MIADMLLDEDGCIITSNEDRYLVKQVKDLHDILNTLK